jgi:hypothetical protein
VKVDANTSKDVSPVNHHVLEITPQVSMIPNNVLPVRDHHLFDMKKLELLKVDILEVQALKPQVLNIKSLNFRGSCFGFQSSDVVHVLEDRITNVNETMKDPQDLNTSKYKLKQSGGVVLTNFELDLKTTLTHVLGIDEIDHVSNKYLQDVEDWVEGATTRALDDFHVSDFALV